MHKSPRRHHYIPQFLLRNFLCPLEENLYCFNKHNGNIFQSTPANLFLEKDFYTINDQAIMEYFYSNLIETHCAPVIERLLKSYSLQDLSKNDFLTLNMFVVAQWARTHRNKDFIRNLVKGFQQKLQKIQKTSDKPLLDQYGQAIPLDSLNENEINQLQAQMLLGAFPLYIQALEMNKSYYLLYAAKAQDYYYIGDNPVVMHQSHPHSLYGSYGLSVPFIEIYLPLSPKLTLAIVDKALPLTHLHPHRSTILTNSMSVRFLNALQIRWARQYIASGSPNFHTAADFLEKNPIFKTEQEGTNIKF